MQENYLNLKFFICLVFKKLMSVISMLWFSFSLCSCSRVDVSAASQAWRDSESHSRSQPGQVGGGELLELSKKLSGQSGATTEGRGEAWRARSTDAPGVMVQGCENRGRSKVWGKWQRTLWPPESATPGIVSHWAGSLWRNLQNTFSIPLSSEHGREWDETWFLPPLYRWG